MSATTEVGYFLRRAAQSIKAMAESTDAGARLAHRQLAAAYHRRAQGAPVPAPADPPPATPIPPEAEPARAHEGGSA